MSNSNLNKLMDSFSQLFESAGELLDQAVDSISQDLESKTADIKSSFDQVKESFADSLEEAYNKNRNRKDEEASMKKIIIDDDNYLMINDDEIVIYQKAGSICQNVRLSYNLFKKINLAVSDFRKDSEGYALVFKQKDPLKELNIWDKHATKIPKGTVIYGHYSDLAAVEKAVKKYDPVKYWKYRVTITGTVPSIIMNTDKAVSDDEQVIAYTSDIKEAEDILNHTIAV